MSTVRFSSMWSCLAVWILLDAVMIVCGDKLPSWISFDGHRGLDRDFSTAFFVAFVWLMFRQTPALPSQDGGAS